jgi:hypothetical protein
MKSILVIAWEFPGVNTIQGTALARRIGQVVKGLSSHYTIWVIHPNHANEKEEWIKINENLYRLPIQNFKFSFPKNPFLRKIKTFFYALTIGDYTSIWARKAFKRLSAFSLTYDVCISFFTPRAPLWLGYLLKKKFNKPWMVDFQDPYIEGVENYLLKKMIKWWTKKVASKADCRIHINEIIANYDSHALGLEFKVLPHAVPLPYINLRENKFVEIRQDKITFIYAGSLDPKIQFPYVLFSVVNKTKHTIQFKIASQKSVYNLFKNNIHNRNIEITYLGWLSNQELKKEVSQSDAILLFPKKIFVIPSKLYEYLSWDVPICICGEDAGVLVNFLKKISSDHLINDTEEKFLACLEKMANNDYSMCLNPLVIRDRIYNEDHLVYDYRKEIEKIL